MLADPSQSCFRTNTLGSIQLVLPHKEHTGVNLPSGWALIILGSTKTSSPICPGAHRSLLCAEVG